ncbi:GDP-L-galactose phosphorylase 1-like protein [Tanacetum coccineum]
MVPVDYGDVVAIQGAEVRLTYDGDTYARVQGLCSKSFSRSLLLDSQMNPAVWEISRHIVLKRKEDYEGAFEKKD